MWYEWKPYPGNEAPGGRDRPGPTSEPRGGRGAGAGKSLLQSIPKHKWQANRTNKQMEKNRGTKKMGPHWSRPAREKVCTKEKATTSVPWHLRRGVIPVLQHSGPQQTPTGIRPIEQEETAKRYSRQQRSQKHASPHARQNSIPSRKSGKRPAACHHCKAPSRPADRETLQSDCHHQKKIRD
ncbi:hypothetical protein NDU88_005985 [Pleurodeles waltl]|uniref:Uncharacterized protein n=1 Tax=Pleurodeles waltl TaxID=8319 RepID=A0AAV7TVW4_PLEWA|nr:hypothetical protein NDU88_005985 [Pleurodeles waltl]